MTTGAKETAREFKGPDGAMLEIVDGAVWVGNCVRLSARDLLAAAAWLAPAREAGVPEDDHIASLRRFLNARAGDDHDKPMRLPCGRAITVIKSLDEMLRDEESERKTLVRETLAQFTSQSPTPAKIEPTKSSQEMWNRTRAIADEGARRLAAGNYSSPEDACRSVAEEVVTELVIPAHAAGDSAGYARGLAEGAKSERAKQERTKRHTHHDVDEFYKDDPTPPSPPQDKAACTCRGMGMDRRWQSCPACSQGAATSPVGEPGPGRDPTIQERARRIMAAVPLHLEGVGGSVCALAIRELTEAVAQARREEREKIALNLPVPAYPKGSQP